VNYSFNDVFYYIGLESGSCVDCQWRDRNLSDYIKKTLICLTKLQVWNDMSMCNLINDSIFISG